MDKNKLNELLDSIYELEGLVHLALTRDDNPDRLPSLIKLKGEKLSELASCFSEEMPMESMPVEEMPIEEDIHSVVESVFNDLPQEVSSYKHEQSPLKEKEQPSKAPLEREPRGRLVFSINDRYRFKRELFDNSDVDFNNTLAIVASMESYDEAEDYFLNELQWDPKREDVADFLEVIKRYFKE